MGAHSQEDNPLSIYIWNLMSRTIRIIDHKKVSLTNDEFKLYQEICAAYDRPKFKGADLFKDLFESDEYGRILFIRPPSKNYSSHEVIYFLITIMTHQYLSDSCAAVESFLYEGKIMMEELKALRQQLKEDLSSREPQPIPAI